MRATVSSSLRWVGGLCLATGLLAVVAGGWIPIKAQLAQWLVAQSWEQVVELGKPVRPWSWADQHVEGRLRVPELFIDQYVFDDDSGAALAFGPGFSGQSLNSETLVISGHRDTHFAFLQSLQPGMRIELERAGDVRGRRFRVMRAEVVDSRSAVLPEITQGGLALVTCYPFDGVVPGGSLRYVVVAEPERLAMAGILSL